jgi:hypothetical protein
MWASVVAVSTLASRPLALAAAGTSFPSKTLGGLSGFTTTPTALTLGATSRTISRRFIAKGGGEECHAGHVAGRSVEAIHQPECDGVAADREHDGYRGGGRLSRQGRGSAADRRNQPNPSTNEISGHCGQPIILSFGPLMLDRDIDILDVTDIAQAAVECARNASRIAG